MGVFAFERRTEGLYRAAVCAHRGGVCGRKVVAEVRWDLGEAGGVGGKGEVWVYDYECARTAGGVAVEGGERG